MQKLLNEWRQYLEEGRRKGKRKRKRFTVEDVEQAVLKYKGSTIDGMDLGTLLRIVTDVETGSTFNPYAKNDLGYRGAFQLSADRAKGINPYNPYLAAERVIKSFVTVRNNLINKFEFIQPAIDTWGLPFFYYVTHQQGRTGAVRIFAAASGAEEKLPGKHLDGGTIKRMMGQNKGLAAQIKPLLIEQRNIRREIHKQGKNIEAAQDSNKDMQKLNKLKTRSKEIEKEIAVMFLKFFKPKMLKADRSAKSFINEQPRQSREPLKCTGCR
tara:strand:+ start:565 stop:1371 length:807 start_codon:yes stop_codon:yes gene_type:complete